MSRSDVVNKIKSNKLFIYFIGALIRVTIICLCIMIVEEYFNKHPYKCITYSIIILALFLLHKKYLDHFKTI